MKKTLVLICAIALALTNCGTDNDDNIKTTASVDFKLSHNFDNTEVNATNYNTLDLTNANGEVINIERIRYLISRITLTSTAGVSYQLKDYNFTDLSNNSTYLFSGTSEIPQGSYKVSLIWGFNEADNVDSAYPDLNSVSWNWPMPLGGGYHFLQFDGKYNVNTMSPEPFNFHNGTARVSTGVFEQNFVEIALPESIEINGNSEIELKMNIAELFKNPNTWDLNVLNTPLMPNYNAQKMMQANVASVFSLGTVTAK